MTRPKKRLAILAQFDPEGGLPAHVRIHLERLNSVVDKLVLVSNSPLDDTSERLALERCDRVLVRPNIGWDFAAWRDVLSQENTTIWDEVILTNSSVIGPLWPIHDLLDQMSAEENDFWGMVLSKARKLHLQSYFLCFKKNVISTPAWSDFWSDVENLTDKKSVILRYEIGLTQTLLKAGFKAGHVIQNKPFPYSIRLVRAPSRALKGSRIPFDINRINRSTGLHEILIDEGMPYLKASLLWGKDTYRFSSIERVCQNEKVNYPWEAIGFHPLHDTPERE